MMLRKFKAMNSLAYHEKQLEYNIKGLIAEIRLKKNIPDDVLVDLDSPEYSDTIKSSPFNPVPIGGLAKTLGLDTGVLTVEKWRDLCNGWVPADLLPAQSHLRRQVVDTRRGKMLKLNRSAVPIKADGAYDYKSTEKNRRPGTEFLFTFGSNLSTVIAHMSIKDPSIEKQFNEICMEVFNEDIMPELLKDAGIRKGKDGKELHRVKEIIAVPYFHIENRALNENLHFHFDLMNVAMGFDDRLYTLNTDLIGKNASKYDAIFMSRTKAKLEKRMGFNFKKVFHKDDEADDFLKDADRKVVSFDLPDAAIPFNVREQRMTREKEIDAEMKRLKQSGYTAKEIARLETRDEKTDLSPSELKALWKENYDRLGWTHEQMMIDLEKVNANFQQEPPPDDLTIERSLLRHTKEVNFTEDQFKAHIIKQLIGHMPSEQAEREAERIFKAEAVMIMDKERTEFFKPFLNGEITDLTEYQSMQIRYGREVTFTTRRIVEMDEYVVNSLKEREKETSFMLDKNHVHKAMFEFESSKGFNLAPGQRDAIISATTAPGAVCSIQGRAGSGKSSLLKVVVAQYEANGFEVWGTSTSTTATKGLQESTGMNAQQTLNSAKLLQQLESKKIQLTAKSVVIVEEAGMRDTETYYNLIKHANESGAKIILSGEREQLSSVGFGGHLSTIGDRFNTAKVKDINRQKEQAEREMVEDFASGRSQKSVKYLYEQGRVIITDTTKQRVEKLVDDYFASTHAMKDKIVIAATNDDVEALNDGIRDRLKAQGKLSGEEVTVKGRDGFERDFALGDKIIITKNTKSDDLAEAALDNSQGGEVIEFRKGQRGQITSFKLKMDDGKEVWMSATKEQNIRHAYAVTVHKSQGQTVQETFYFVSSNLNSLNQAYVACSRHTQKVSMYLSRDMVEIMAETMDNKAPTAQQIKVAEWVAKKSGIELPEDVRTSFMACRNFLNEKYEKIEGSARSPVDDFISIVESMSKAQFKKTSFDYEILDGKHRNTYEAARLYQAQMDINDKLKKQIKVQMKPTANTTITGLNM